MLRLLTLSTALALCGASSGTDDPSQRFRKGERAKVVNIPRYEGLEVTVLKWIKPKYMVDWDDGTRSAVWISEAEIAKEGLKHGVTVARRVAEKPGRWKIKLPDGALRGVKNENLEKLPPNSAAATSPAAPTAPASAIDAAGRPQSRSTSSSKAWWPTEHAPQPVPECTTSAPDPKPRLVDEAASHVGAGAGAFSWAPEGMDDAGRQEWAEWMLRNLRQNKQRQEAARSERTETVWREELHNATEPLEKLWALRGAKPSVVDKGSPAYTEARKIGQAMYDAQPGTCYAHKKHPLLDAVESLNQRAKREDGRIWISFGECVARAWKYIGRHECAYNQGFQP